MEPYCWCKWRRNKTKLILKKPNKPKSKYCSNGCDLKIIETVVTPHGDRKTYRLIYECQKCKRRI